MSVPTIDLGIAKPRRETRVVVAMSGGVDSSVTAALLAEAGYGVVGITLQLYDDGAARGKAGACCAGQDIHDAKRVAARLGIPHYVLNYEARFHEAVVEEFAEAYTRGETPIPCVRCNERVKFRDLLETARDLGADALATGHYARRVAGADGPALYRARDEARDQSYFLFATTREQLAFLRFPLGDMPKEAVRRHAARLGLDIAEKPDSQDICFVPQGGYARVIERLKPGAAEPGDIVDLAGRALGRHDGVIHYTIGQRRGLGIASSEPLYVVRLDAARREVVVGPAVALMSDRIQLGPLNWLEGAGEPPTHRPVTARIRSSHPGAPATLSVRSGGAAELRLETPEPATAPGQAAVLYEGDRVLGGGWITSMGRSAARDPASAAAVVIPTPWRPGRWPPGSSPAASAP